MSEILPNATTTKVTPFVFDLTWDDATWILTASFIIFTMQTGFGMLESGCVSVKNEANIMMKNVVDVVFGGLTYWIFGFSMSFGTDDGSSPYFGVGNYAVDSDYDTMGPIFAAFLFQLSFATTATTIVSGTMAERCNFRSYCVFSCLNTVVYCVPARWIWGPTGFLSEMGVIDIAGSGAVHLLGGVSGYIAAWMLGPRYGRYDNGPDPLPLGNPVSCIVGLYILWFGWLAFNSGSTFGVSGVKWMFAARAAVSTMIASFGGGIIGALYAFKRQGRIFAPMDLINPVLGALVAITAGCALYHTRDAFLIGAIGGAVIIATSGFTDATRVDDPVGATPVHAFGGIWGLLAVGLFAEDDNGAGFSKGHSGLFRGGGFYLLGVQALACVCISVWAVCITFVLLWGINKVIPIRMLPYEELLGADFVEHLIRRQHAGLTPAVSAVLHSRASVQLIVDTAVTIGASNPKHDAILDTLNELSGRRWMKNRFKKLVSRILKSRKIKVGNESAYSLSSVEFETNPEETTSRYSNPGPGILKASSHYMDHLGLPHAGSTNFNTNWQSNFDTDYNTKY